MLLSTAIRYLVVHCSDTPDAEDIQPRDIHAMHQGFGWHGIGYHRLITRDGICHAARPEYWQGAHVHGRNTESLGVCLIGRTHFTPAQFSALESLLRTWTAQYPQAEIVGHRDIQQTPIKTCPNFDVRQWWQSRLPHLAQHAFILSPHAPLFDAPPPNPQNLISEVLYGEQVQITDNTPQNGFIPIQQIDGYRGWIDAHHLTRLAAADQPTTPITMPCVTVTQAPDIKSPSLCTLSLGARVKPLSAPSQAQNAQAKNAQTAPSQTEILLFGRGGEHKTGFIPSFALAPRPRSEIMDLVTLFIGTPYKWGGRSYHGLDCSALIQLTFSACGIDIPRDSTPQAEHLTAHALPAPKAYQHFAAGDLLYWQGHVGIMRDETHLVHANAYHHAVAVEPVRKTIARFSAANIPPLMHVPFTVFL